MALNFDNTMNNARSIIRGEAVGSPRLLIITIIALCCWVGVSFINNQVNTSNMTLSNQENRYRTLTGLAAEYSELAPLRAANKDNNKSGNVDVPAVFAQISEEMQLGTRVNRIAPDGRNQSVEINRLYADELADLERKLAAAGVFFKSAEVRALPAGYERLFTISAIIGPLN
ncbi:MAG: hypothetical protein IJP56_08840 [Synergistaceae bacterium]|nr:hypothetical protein [Synergistaceae bacterium]MBQ9896587.1 hypothetical protein [Synergistaceae bacterium]MBR0044927.1 hypothetical protein [Synergistaceae bacterium]